MIFGAVNVLLAKSTEPKTCADIRIRGEGERDARVVLCLFLFELFQNSHIIEVSFGSYQRVTIFATLNFLQAHYPLCANWALHLIIKVRKKIRIGSEFNEKWR